MYTSDDTQAEIQDLWALLRLALAKSNSILPFLTVPVFEAAGTTLSIVHGGNNNFWWEAGAQSNAELSVAPHVGDVVLLKQIGAFSSPLLITPRGGFTVEDPGNPGNFFSDPVSFAGQGNSLLYQFGPITGEANGWAIIAAF